LGKVLRIDLVGATFEKMLYVGSTNQNLFGQILRSGFQKEKRKKEKKHYCNLHSTMVATWWWPLRGPCQTVLVAIVGPSDRSGGHCGAARSSWRSLWGRQKFIVIIFGKCFVFYFLRNVL